jgi:hypothetical protein
MSFPVPVALSLRLCSAICGANRQFLDSDSGRYGRGLERTVRRSTGETSIVVAGAAHDSPNRCA